MSKPAVLLIAHGSPERVEDIPEFLQNISRGRPLPEAVVREVQHRYLLIGSSPLTKITRAQADGVSRELALPAYVGMRNWHPFIAATLRQMESDNVGQAVAICLAPHNSQTSVGRSSHADRSLCRQAAHWLGKRLPAARRAVTGVVYRA
jgi:ferrochelatase